MPADNPVERDYDFVRSRLVRGEEIAFLDVREEALHAQGHPLFAANLPLARIELDALNKMPRLEVPVVLLDDGKGEASIARERLVSLGYRDVAVFRGGLAAWKQAGGEVFIDVNVPSKAFGELVEATCHTPSLGAEEVKAMLDAGEDMIVVDVRRFDEYQTMSIPTGISVPGAELVLRVPDLAKRPTTHIVVNCAGRTRSLIGAQSLINAGLRNPISALRNGTIGWLLAGQALEFEQSRTPAPTSPETMTAASQRARRLADRASVKRATREQVAAWARQEERTTYFFDVRSPAEFWHGHPPGFRSTPGGQLVQETEMYAPVRGGRIVLVDDDGVRANMTASWLAQMAWDVHVLDGLSANDFSQSGPAESTLPALPEVPGVSAEELHDWVSSREVTVIDVARHATFVRGHVPGAWWLLRSRLASSVALLPRVGPYVVTSDDGLLARLVASELAECVDGEVLVLRGGTQSWVSGGYELEVGAQRLTSPPIDRYRRPYEGTDASREAMQAYLDWEFGLVEQLRRDGTHHFRPLMPND